MSPDGSPASTKISERRMARLSRGRRRRRRSRTGRWRSASSTTSGCSMIRHWPASTAMPSSPAAAAARTVAGPIVGRSARRSCFGFLSLIRTPPGPSRRRPAQRASSWSVPSTASTPSTRPCCTTTAWPTSSSPRRVATATPWAMSRRAAASGAVRVSRPSGASSVPITSSAPTTRKPSASSSPTIAWNSRSSPRPARSPSLPSSCTPRQSSFMVAKDGRRTGPIITTSSLPAACSAPSVRPTAPSGTHWWGTPSTAAGSVSPSKASTKTSRPAARAAPITCRGNGPLPASTASLGAMAQPIRFWRGMQIARLPALRMKSTISITRL